MSTPTLPPTIDVTQLVMQVVAGPMILGIFCELWLFGIVFAQVVVYRLRYPGDPMHLKLLVAIMTGGDLLNMILNIKAVYGDYIFGRFNHLAGPVPWFVLAAPIVGQIPVLSSQIYLCFRVWVVSGRKVIPTAIGAIMTMLQLSLNILYSTRRIMARGLGVDPGSSVNRLMPPWAFTNAAADVCLSFTLAYYLLKTRKQSISYRFNYILVRLASIAITTCLPPACISVALALLEILETRKLVWIFFGQILGCAYTLCILYALNSREALAQRATLCPSGTSSRMTPGIRLPATTLSVRFDDPEASIGRESQRKVELPSGGSLGRSLMGVEGEKVEQVETDAIGGAFAIATTKRVSLVCS
ncbi:BZ3500_MvSof-1268-A1-R1_Chr10-1g02548 [Microbotryum saponariae]|uniref:BZ3500_MvSof-1268-A1-R1_Chr10-1g02548 protein n=1 Tax=Microbotryum saponariae TaxID=289078 RepID=A0A2X0N8P8_9BASI|nr:BZ3500_MvSof-1268-A1-R1_Chr10-1g02548 [Microbotryum saponariae]SDA06037.1 BZ3501_MvSof-1269-A2-R1_Chr10-1g02149 [Microbotryum saponariae]